MATGRRPTGGAVLRWTGALLYGAALVGIGFAGDALEDWAYFGWLLLSLAAGYVIRDVRALLVPALLVIVWVTYVVLEWQTEGPSYEDTLPSIVVFVLYVGLLVGGAYSLGLLLGIWRTSRR